MPSAGKRPLRGAQGVGTSGTVEGEYQEGGRVEGGWREREREGGRVERVKIVKGERGRGEGGEREREIAGERGACQCIL